MHGRSRDSADRQSTSSAARAHGHQQFAPHVERMNSPLEVDAERRAGTAQTPATLRTDDAAANAAEAFGARAITVGNEIMFGRGQYAPGTPQGDHLIAHERAHVDQFAEGKVPPGVVPRWPIDIPVGVYEALESTSDDPDRVWGAKEQSPKSPLQDDVLPEAVEPFTPIFAGEPGANMLQDLTTFLVPEGTSYSEIAERVFHDSKHVGGFVHDGRKVKLTSFEGVVDEFTSKMRKLLDDEIADDVKRLISRVSERRIDGDDERYMINTIVWWADRGELTNAAGRSYFDKLIDELESRTLTEWGVISDTERSVLDWIMIEVEEKQYQLIPLIAKRRNKQAKYPRGGDRIKEMDPVVGQLPEKGWGAIIGEYTYEQPAPKMALYSTSYGSGNIFINKQLDIAAPTKAEAELALRNSPYTGPRVMVPGRDGKFYGYGVQFPFFEAGYTPGEQKMTNYWWHYPGTVFIPGGEYHAEFGEGKAEEHKQRQAILDSALAARTNEAIRGLDFDVLSLATLDQRFVMLQHCVDKRTVDDASLIARILYSTPIAQFPALERRLSTSGLMAQLMGNVWPGGALGAIGRVFTVRAMQSMRVPGEGQTQLPEFYVGYDSDGYYHYGYARKAEQTASKALATPDFKAGDAVSIGHEQALPGEASHDISSSVVTIQPAIFRSGGFFGNAYRGLKQTLVDDYGPAVGPLLPTQLVRIKTYDLVPTERVVTAVEALGILDRSAEGMLMTVLKTHISGGVKLLAGMQLLRAFGPALMEGLGEGGGAEAVLASLGRAAATELGAAALNNAVLVGAIEIVEAYREELKQTATGREFLELFDTVLMIWVARDVTRLIATGVLPRLVRSIDWAITKGAALRNGLMPLRAELEALRRTVARYATPAEAAEAAAAGGGTAAVSAEGKPGFFTLLRISRGEVAAEGLAAKTAGTAAEGTAKRVLDRLGSAVERAETAAARAAPAEKAEAEAAVERAARARLNVAQRASQLRPDAREKFLAAVDAAIATRPNSLEAIADLLSAAAASRQPTVYIAEVQKLLDRGTGISDEALTQLGKKAAAGSNVLDLAWLNRTTISNEALDFLGRDKRTPWDLYRRAASDPSAGGVMRAFRTSARGAGAEMVGEAEAMKLGTGVRRQVQMGGSEIDFELIVANAKRGLEIKGWTVETWKEALALALRRLKPKAPPLTAAEEKIVGKIDHMLKQLKDIQTATGKPPLLGVTDALPPDLKSALKQVLEREGVTGTKFVPLSEAEIKEAAAGTIGEALGVPRP
jgi:hypothetical protein